MHSGVGTELGGSGSPGGHRGWLLSRRRRDSDEKQVHRLRHRAGRVTGVLAPGRAHVPGQQSREPCGVDVFSRKSLKQVYNLYDILTKYRLTNLKRIRKLWYCFLKKNWINFQAVTYKEDLRWSL